MVRSCQLVDNRCKVHFRAAPWPEGSPEWNKLDQQLPEDHSARWIVERVKALDLTELLNSYHAGGDDPFPPQLMLNIVLIESCLGRPSPSRWAGDARMHDALKWGGQGICPSRSSCYNFRKRLGRFVDALVQQTVKQGVALELTTAQRGVLDGTLLAALASRHRLVSEVPLEKRRQALVAAEQCDQQQQPLEAVPGWMAKTPAGRAKQLARCERAAVVLHGRLAANQRHSTNKRRSRERVVVSLSEPEVAIGPDKQGVCRPVYNMQAVRDLDSPLVLAYKVLPQCNDNGAMQVMLDLFGRQGLPVTTLPADLGYDSIADVVMCRARGIDLILPTGDRAAGDANADQKGRIPTAQFQWMPAEDAFRCPRGQSMPRRSSRTRITPDRFSYVEHYRCSRQICSSCPLRSRCAPSGKGLRELTRHEHQDLLDCECARMAEPESQAIYRLRKQTIEVLVYRPQNWGSALLGGWCILAPSWMAMFPNPNARLVASCLSDSTSSSRNSPSKPRRSSCY